jgi:hypothetical protein
LNKYPSLVVKLAKKLWIEVMNTKKIIRAGPRNGLIISCVYFSCIYYGVPKSSLEISNDFGFKDTKNFNKGYKEFVKIFKNNKKYKHILAESVSIESYFTQMSSTLQEKGFIQSAYWIEKECYITASELNEIFDYMYPRTIASGILFYVCEKFSIPINKVKFSKLFNICSPTLSKVVKKIKKAFSNIENDKN